MRVYTDLHIATLIKAKRLAENASQEERKEGNFTTASEISPFIGKQKDKPVITAGFKIKHKESGLVYTVQSVAFDNSDIVIQAISGDGHEIKINSKEFKSYERL